MGFPHWMSSMGAQWKQAGREANAQKKGQMVAKLVRELMVAAKLGGPDPDLNPRLAAAVEKARKASVYRDTIERAIKKGSGQTDEKVTFDLITFEGIAQEIEPLEPEEIPEGEKGARFLTEIKDLDAVSKALKAAGWKIVSSEIRYIAKNLAQVNETSRKEVTDFLNTLDDHDDVHR